MVKDQDKEQGGELRRRGDDGGREMVLQENKETSDRTRGGEVRVDRGKARCSGEREREGGGKGYNDVIA